MLRDETKKLLEEYGIKLSKRKGQSHLVDESVLEKILDYADLSSSDKVLEIGPGIGNLTSFLLEKAGEVYAVERDENLARILRDRFRGEKNLEIKKGDVLEIDFPEFDKVVANLPYSISSPITFKILKHEFDLGILMYQKEFADRMVAETGSSDYSRLTVHVEYRSEVEILEDVSPTSFMPQPEVWSSIIKIKPKDPPFQVRDEKIFLATVKASFQHRRQKVRNSLSHSFHEIFPDLDISDKQKRKLIDKSIPEELANSRAGEISPEKFGVIADILVENID